MAVGNLTHENRAGPLAYGEPPTIRRPGQGEGTSRKLGDRRPVTGRPDPELIASGSEPPVAAPGQRKGRTLLSRKVTADGWPVHVPDPGLIAGEGPGQPAVRPPGHLPSLGVRTGQMLQQSAAFGVVDIDGVPVEHGQ